MPAFNEIIRASDNVTWKVWIDAENSIIVDRAGTMSLLTGQDRQNPARIAQVASDVLQMLWDAPTRQLLTDLPLDDPDRTIDPGRPDQFHARAAETVGQGQNRIDIYRPTALVGGVATHLIGRNSLLSVIYTGSIDTASIITESPPRSLR